MPTISHTPSELRASGEPGRDARGVVAGGFALLALVAIDLSLGSHTSLVGTFAIAPFVAALVGGLRSALAVGAAAVLATLVVPAWNMNFGESAYYLRLAAVAATSAFSVLAAWALQRSRLVTARLELLDAIGAIATGAFPLDETLRLATQRIAPAIADFCMIDAIAEPGVTRAAVGIADHPRRGEIEAWLQSRRPSIPERFTERREAGDWPEPFLRSPMTDDDLQGLAHDPDDLEFLRSLGIRSTMTVPLVARGHSLGALTMVAAWSGRVYDSEDVNFAEILAGRVALTLDNAGLFSDLESVERRMDNVMEILDEAVVLHDAGGELIYANPAAARTMGFDSVDELLATPTDEIRSRFTVHREDGSGVSPEEFVGRRVLRGEEAEPLVLRSIDRRTGEERWQLTKAKPITGPDGKVLYSVTAIEDVTEVKRAEFAQRLLARAGNLLASSTDYRRTLSEIATLLVPEFADWCGVNLPGDDGFVDQVAAAHRDPEKVQLAIDMRSRYPIPMSDPGGVARVLRTGEAQLVEITDETLGSLARDAEHLEILRRLDARSAIAVPMSAGPKIVGALVFINESSSRRFDESDLELAHELARRTGVAVDNARLAGERAEIATVLQRGLLPPALPAMTGWEVATMYRPAGEVNEVGGDFYDAFPIDGGWMVVVGDVVGRGPEAASLTALARYTLRTAGILTGDPRIALSMLNEALRARAEIAPCTVAVVVLPDEETPEVDVMVACAGHPLPLLIRDEAVGEVGAPGPLLGAFDVSAWEVERVPLAPGDQLAVYTDGVIEARGRADRFGEERLRSQLSGANRPVHAIARIETALEQFVSGTPDDDAAMVAILRLGGSRRRKGGLRAVAAGGG
jgi:PAS domain S-box-containing protein